MATHSASLEKTCSRSILTPITDREGRGMFHFVSRTACKLMHTHACIKAPNTKMATRDATRIHVSHLTDHSVTCYSTVSDSAQDGRYSAQSDEIESRPESVLISGVGVARNVWRCCDNSRRCPRGRGSKDASCDCSVRIDVLRTSARGLFHRRGVFFIAHLTSHFSYNINQEHCGRGGWTPTTEASGPSSMGTG